MTTKQYLQSIEDLDRRIEGKLMDKYRLQTMLMRITVSTEGERVQSSPEPDRMANTIAKIIELEKEIDGLVDDFIDRRQHIVSQIDAMENPTYRHILNMRYIGRENLDKIAESLAPKVRTRRHTDRLHGQAMMEFERLYGEEYLDG